MNDLTLKKIFEIIRQSEIQAKEERKMRQEINEEVEVNRKEINQKGKNFYKQRRDSNKDITSRRADMRQMWKSLPHARKKMSCGEVRMSQM